MPWRKRAASVRGYTRRDGTYVRPYTRSSPGSDAGGSSSGITFTPSVNFRSCAQARAVGYSTITAGNAAASSALDRNGDGLACESGDADASMQPHTGSAMIAAVLPGRTLIREVTVRDLREAELLAAELAVLHAPLRQPLHLRLDCANAYMGLSGGDPGPRPLLHAEVAQRILSLAQARGIELRVQQIPSAQNRAHGPALAAHRQADSRPRLEVRLNVQGNRVRVRGEGLKLDDTYPAPVTLHALCALAEALSPQVIALVQGVSPLSEAYWWASKAAPPPLRRAVERARRVLGERRSEIRPVRTWWEDRRR